ncbi:MAG TPA: hypothetical protein VIW29_23080 [Polyangiaceae bacterium]
MLGSPGPRVRVALALASVLHALALVSLYAWARHAASPSSPGAAAEQSIHLELLALPSAATELEPAPVLPRDSVAGGGLDARLAPRLAPRAGLAPPAPLPAAIDRDRAGPEPGDAPDPSDDAPELAPSAERAIDLGVGPEAWRKWARLGQAESPAPPKRKKRARAPVAHAPPVSTSGGLLEGLEAHDRELGLGPSGPVIGALYRAAHNPIAPQTGFARFEITVLKSGSVEVSLAGASGQAEAWASVGKLASEAIRQSPPRIPEPRTGTRMVVTIRAEQVFPNGTKREDLSGPHLEGVAPRLRTEGDAKAELKRLNPVAGDTGAPVTGQSVMVDIPGVYVAGRNKVCSYRLGITPLGPMLSGGCDLANAGSKAQRMVRTEVEEQAMF